jgi:hypothetical protein
MVANYESGTSATTPHAATGVTPEVGDRPREHAAGPRQAISDLMQSLKRVGSLQAQLWATRTKMKVANALIMAALLGAAGVLGVLAVIFLYIGVFHLLTDIAHMQRTWVYLIYFGVHVVGMAILLGVVKSKSHGKRPRAAKSKSGGKY